MSDRKTNTKSTKKTSLQTEEKKDPISVKIFTDLIRKIMNKNGTSRKSIMEEIGYDDDTGKNLFNKGTLNARVSIAFCRFYGFDVNDIYYYPSEIYNANDENTRTKMINNYVEMLMEKRSTNESPSEYDFTDIQKKLRSSRSRVLDDEHFFGTFYGYCYNSAFHGDNLDSFTLKIHKDNENNVLADLELDCYSEDDYSNETCRKEKLSGVPIQLGENLIYIIFNDTNSNELYVFVYERFEMKDRSKLKCRRGALLSTQRGNPPHPQIQSFIFTDKKVAKENLHRVKGLLNLVQGKIYLPESTFNELMENNENVRMCAEKGFFGNETKNMRIIKEKAVFNNGQDEIHPQILADVLCTLREHSVNPRYITFPDNEEFGKSNSKLLMSLREEDLS